MLIHTFLIALLGAGSPWVQEENTPPVKEQPAEQIERSEVEEDEEDIVDRGSKNRQEYNLYDREQNRSPYPGQYYYYQQGPEQDGYQGRKLYQRDNG